MRPASAMQRLKLSLASPLFYRSRTMSLDEAIARADSVIYAYSAYMLTSLEFKTVIMNDFIDMIHRNPQTF